MKKQLKTLSITALIFSSGLMVQAYAGTELPSEKYLTCSDMQVLNNQIKQDAVDWESLGMGGGISNGHEETYEDWSSRFNFEKKMSKLAVYCTAQKHIALSLSDDLNTQATLANSNDYRPTRLKKTVSLALNRMVEESERMTALDGSPFFDGFRQKGLSAQLGIPSRNEETNSVAISLKKSMELTDLYIKIAATGSAPLSDIFNYFFDMAEGEEDLIARLINALDHGLFFLTNYGDQKVKLSLGVSHSEL